MQSKHGGFVRQVLESRDGADDSSTLPPELAVTLPRLMDQKTFAGYIGKSIAWCERARWAGEGPPYIKLGRHVRYRADDVLRWIQENARRSTSDE